MDERDAAELVRLAVHIQEEANRPMFCLAAAVSPHGRTRLKHVVGHLILSADDQIIRPVARMFPGVEPGDGDPCDRPTERGPNHRSPDSAPAGRRGPITPACVLRKSIQESARAAGADLERITNLIERCATGAELTHFKRRVKRVEARIKDLESLVAEL